ncbi:MAG TPA: Wzz/FepE/Etk N-terminal domain-containing protein [Burkholderiaceae bacterium]
MQHDDHVSPGQASGFPGSAAFEDEDDGIDFGALLARARRHWRELAGTTVAACAIGYGISFVVTPLYTSHTTLIPPQQQQQGGAAAALSSLGVLSSLAGGAMKSPVEQYISLMESDAVTDRLIDRFGLMKVYDYKYRDSTRKKLLKRSEITAGKKDGLITVKVEDSDPKRAAAMANQYVEELRHMTSTLAVTEAQQRRMFFQNQMQEARNKLAEAQSALQQSGFGQGALNAAPQTAAAGYARLRTELASAQVRLATLQGSLAPGAPEVQQQSTMVAALQDQLRQLEANPDAKANGPDYVTKYREFKYEETVFELMAKQYELARVDEAKEGAIIQVVDPAQPPERRSFPRRLYFAAGGAAAGLLLGAALLFFRERRTQAAAA